MFGTLNVVDIDARALGAARFAAACGDRARGLSPPGWPAGTIRLQSSGAPSRGGCRHRRGWPRKVFSSRRLRWPRRSCVGTTVLIRSFVNLMLTDRGLSVEGVVRIRVSGMDNAFAASDAMAHGLDAVRASVAEWPEVRVSALSRELPPLSQGAGGEARAEGLDGYRVSPEFFGIYGIAIVAGRVFDTAVGADEIVVGERLAGQLWPGEDPCGTHLPDAGCTGTGEWSASPARSAFRHWTLTLDRPEFYLPLNNTSRTLYLSLRCNAACPDPQTIDDRLRRVHPVLSGRLVAAGEDAYAAQLDLPHAIAQVSGTFAAVALLTAACGLFSVLSYIARRRRREFGIRQMLGASPSHLRQLILGMACGSFARSRHRRPGGLGSRPAARLTALWSERSGSADLGDAARPPDSHRLRRHVGPVSHGGVRQSRDADSRGVEMMLFPTADYDRDGDIAPMSRPCRRPTRGPNPSRR